MTEYVERDIALAVQEALKEMPVVIITGMRQTGKTTFLHMQPGFKGRRYVTLDDFAQLEAAKLDPEGLVHTDEPLAIDEAQKCPEILTAIKRVVDRKRTPGQFLLTGSANFAILKGISESLAGRSVYLVLHPFSRRELVQRTKRKPFLQSFFESMKNPRGEGSGKIGLEEILIGGMPTVCLGEIKNRFLWFKGYEQTYLERDVRQLSQIGNTIAFRHLLRLTALRTGQILSLSQIGRDSKLNVQTTSRYLSLLEASFIIYRLSPYLRNKATRLIKSPKVYMSDSGLASYLAGVDSIESASREPLMGAMFETYVAQNLSSMVDARWPEARLHFWNVQGRYEVDFVLEVGNKCIAIEVKAASRWVERDLAGLRTFLAATPQCVAAILAYNGAEPVRLGEKVWAIPLGLLLS
ncbi:MAG: ATP-binding protein [Candidatus Eisenbacteria bacterium]|nr:ATP-binding protein [Candidatus Eisenbacteria bacterium]